MGNENIDDDANEANVHAATADVDCDRQIVGPSVSVSN